MSAMSNCGPESRRPATTSLGKSEQPDDDRRCTASRSGDPATRPWRYFFIEGDITAVKVGLPAFRLLFPGEAGEGTKDRGHKEGTE